jgi:hypothetical protein
LTGDLYRKRPYIRSSKGAYNPCHVLRIGIARKDIIKAYEDKQGEMKKGIQQDVFAQIGKSKLKEKSKQEYVVIAPDLLRLKTIRKRDVAKYYGVSLWKAKRILDQWDAVDLLKKRIITSTREAVYDTITKPLPKRKEV